MTAKVAFVLGGGGVLGAVQVGMLRAVLERGIRPDLVVGTSIGAINGAIVAADPDRCIDRLDHAWTSRDARVLTTGLGVRPGRAHVMSRGPLVRLLEGALPRVRTFADLEVGFRCCAASIERAAEHWFAEGPLVPAVLASAALPGVFPAVRIGDEHFVDGGIVNSIPISEAAAAGATDIYVMQVGRIEHPLSAPRNQFDNARVAFEISRRHRFARDRAARANATTASPATSPPSPCADGWSGPIRPRPTTSTRRPRRPTRPAGRPPDMRVPPRWVRRLVLAPAVVVAAIAVTALLPLWLVVAVAVSLLLETRLRTPRLLWMGNLYLLWDAAALIGLFALWVASGFGLRIHSPTFRRAHYPFVARGRATRSSSSRRAGTSPNGGAPVRSSGCAAGLHAAADRAARLQNAMAPRPGGFFAALDAAPDADVYFVAHTGLERIRTITDVWRELPTDKTIVMRFWRVPRNEIPTAREERFDWLLQEWEDIDDWIGQHRRQDRDTPGSTRFPPRSEGPAGIR